MINCIQFCFNFAFNFNLHGYAKGLHVRSVVRGIVRTIQERAAGPRTHHDCLLILYRCTHQHSPLAAAS